MTATLCAFSGCIFSPPKKPPQIKPPVIYPVLAYPASVLEALSMAYAAKDSDEIKLLYDRTYIGSSTDNTDQTTLPFSWANEVDHVTALGHHPEVIRVALTFPPSLTRYNDLNDTPGWATIQIIDQMHVEIDTNLTSYALFGSGETITFKFVPKTPDTSSPTDTTWKIIRWTEYHQ
jgi:hypothetical protein